jgi:hypothetical protein
MMEPTDSVFADPAEDTPEQESPEIQPLHDSVEAWVTHVYTTTFIRRTGAATRWCAQWWDHPEAIVRLTSLWLTWESARAAEDPHPMADWLWRYLDTLAPVLHSPDGPFSECDPTDHVPGTPMPTQAAPARYWSTDDQ